MPDEGPALLVCNHVSYMDALILAASIPRPVRFVMYYKIFQHPGDELDLPHRARRSRSRARGKTRS